MIIIREATVDDACGICHINKYAFGYDYPLEKTKLQLEYILSKPANKIFVACDEIIIAGYIHGSDYDCTYSNPLKNIMAIAVDEGYRGNGIGKLLLQAVEEWALQDGCDGVRLVSGMNREKAHEFYLHCGYTLRKTQKNFVKIF